MLLGKHFWYDYVILNWFLYRELILIFPCFVIYFLLQALPTCIADNAGYDSAELVSQLRAQHNQGNHTIGLSKL